MAHVPGSADEIRARVPAVLESYAFIRDNVLLDGPADRELKQLCFRFLAGEIEPSGYEGRERAALEWTEAVTRIADGHVPDEVFASAREHFSEEELVNLTICNGARVVWVVSP